MKIDSYDHKILTILQENSKISNTRLADRVNLSPSACLRRVQALEKSGIIKSYTIMLNQHAVGADTHVMMLITLDGQDSEKLTDFEDAILKIPNVITCYLTSGNHDYLVKVLVKSIQDYDKLHHNLLSKLPHVAKLESNFAIRAVIRRTNYLPEAE